MSKGFKSMAPVIGAGIGMAIPGAGLAGALIGGGIGGMLGGGGSGGGGPTRLAQINPAAERTEQLRDFYRGKEEFEHYLPKDAFGRTSEQVMTARERLAKGLTGTETEAARTEAFTQMNRQTQSQQRALASIQARQGVRGGTAAAQQAGLLQGAAQQRQEFERGLIMQDRSAQLEGLRGLEASQRFDISQRAKEAILPMQAGLTFAQLGTTARAGVQAANASVAAAGAMQPSGGLLGGMLGK